jgi:uncharacterized membrane protein
MMYGPMGGMMGWMLFVPLLGLLVLVAVIYGIYQFFRGQREDDAIMVLRRRFAQGDITEEEFRRRLDLLKK